MKSTQLIRTVLQTTLGSLKFRLALTAVSVIALSVAMTVFLVTRDTGLRAEQSIKDSALDVDTVSKTISSRLLNREQALSRAAEQWPQATAPDAPSAQAFLTQQSVLTALFSRTFVASARDGRVLAMSSDAGVHTSERSILGKRYFEQALRGERSVISELFEDEKSKHLNIVLAVPMRDASGAVYAVLGGVLSPQSDSLLTDSTRASSLARDPIETIITDSSGRIVSHLDPAWLQRDVGEDPRLAEAVARWRGEGAPMTAQAWTWRIGPQFIAMAAVPEANWMVFRTASADLLLGGPAAGRREAIGLGASVAIGGALMILLATSWMLRPMRLLERRALRLLDEDLPIDKGWPASTGEIGRLSAVFKQVLGERALMQRHNDEILARIRAVMLNVPVGIAFSREARLELVNHHLGSLLGYTDVELRGASPGVIFSSEAAGEAFLVRADRTLAAGRVHAEEVHVQHRDGHRFWASVQSAAVDPGDRSAGVIWLMSDISSQRQHREQLSWSATHDVLTDLVNRREFEARLQAQLHDRRRHEMASALFIDLDDFKLVNDSAGHAAGDAMLKQVAAILTRRVREGDTVARLGGDEFAVLLRACDRQTAEAVAEQIRTRVAAIRLPWQGQTLRAGASIGVVEIDESFLDIAAVLAAADAACYAAKRAGRNSVRSHQPAALAVH